MNLRFIILIIMTLVISSGVSLSGYAHGIGGGKDKIVGNYLIDFSYSYYKPNDQRPITLSFELKDTISKNSIEYTNILALILDEEKNLLFRSSIDQNIKGEGALEYLFPKEGSYIIRLKFLNGSETIVGTDFFLDVASGGQQSSTSSLQSGKYVTIIITDNDFSPDFIRIPIGTKVKWVNKGSKLHWPASDLHPTHTRYPGSGIVKCGTSEEKNILDSCQGLKNGEEYSFTFDKSGAWTLHDHLNPAFSMIVEVTDISTGRFSFISRISNTVYKLIQKLFGPKDDLQKITSLSVSPSEKKSVEELIDNVMIACNKENRPEGIDKISCYSLEFRKIAVAYGPDYSFEILSALQQKDKVAEICHVIAHGIGWGTFERDPDKWQDNVATISSTCVYGALHGILERYINTLPDGKITKETLPKFCEKNQHPACIHAVGHIATVETKDNLDEAIELCSAYPQSKRHRFYCLTGVFMEHMIADNLVQHGIYPQSRRQRWYTHLEEFEELCRSHNGENAIACWTEIMHAYSAKYNGDPIQIFNACNSAQVEEGANRCRRHAVGDIILFNVQKNRNFTSMKYICEIDQPNDPTFSRDCYSHIASITLFTIPLKKAHQVAEYCSSLLPQYQNRCFSEIGKILRERSFSETDINNICQAAPEELKEQCINGHAEPVLREIFSPIPETRQLIEEFAGKTREACSRSNRKQDLYKAACYALQFENISFEKGPDFAFEVLYVLQDLDPDASSCHFIGHAIGYGVYEHNPSKSIDYVSNGNRGCSYGFPMGIIERYALEYLKGNFTREDTLLSICGENTPNGCNHVLGHVLITETEGERDAALDYCTVFQKQHRRTSCYDGVFMEVVFPFNLVAHGIANESWFEFSSRIDVIEAICRSYEGEKATSCWGEIARAAMIKYDTNEKVFEFCSTAPTEQNAKICKNHAIGMINAGNHFVLDLIKPTCTIEQPDDPDFANDCYTRSVRAALGVVGPRKVPEVIEFCTSLDYAFWESCLSPIGKRLESYGLSRDEILELCRDVPDEFREGCQGKSIS